MKKTLLIPAALMIFGAAFLSSCSKSEDNTPAPTPPTINFVAKSGFITGDATMTVGSTFKVSLAAFPNTTSGSKLASLKVTRVFQNNPYVALDTTFSLSSLSVDLTATANPNVGQEKWYYRVTDKSGQYAEVSLTITTTSAAGPINSFGMKILGAQSATAGSSFASIDGSVYTLAEAKANQAKVDLMYYYGDTDFATIAAPDDAHALTVFTNAVNGLGTWTTKNDTRFKLVTNAINWDAITDDAVIVQETASGVTESRITNLISGKYLAFITASGKKGMIKIESITTGQTGSVTISVKVQQ
jgi:hypothetical protein